MKCQEARRLLHDLLDDHLTPESESLLRKHLDDCCECKRAERTLRQTVGLLGEMSAVPAPSGFRDELMSKLPSTREHRFPRVLSVACLVLLLLSSPFYFVNALSQPQLISQDRGAIVEQQDGAYMVPTGTVVRGDMIVYRHNLVVQGTVLGNVRMVDGHLDLGEGGSVTGTITEQKSDGAVRMKLALVELWEDIGKWLFR